MAAFPPAPTFSAPRSPRGIDIVVPVYRAVEELARCLDSLLRHTDLGVHRLILVADGPQAQETEERLSLLAARWPEGIVVLRNAERSGFVVSVNRGMEEGSGDVVLLNSDTEVTAGWLEKLARAAASRPRVATVTPFCNSATICSLPRTLETNALPVGWDLDRFASLVEACSTRAYPELPTGVGVCLYIRREALEEVGFFDTQHFGLGYGEESDFCMRASAAGYHHLLDDATFIFHEGSRSFGRERFGRIASAHRRMRRLHPTYLAAVDTFIKRDPLRPLRERVIAALRPSRPEGTDLVTGRGPRRIVHLVHGWPPWNSAGTELYASWLVHEQARHRAVSVFARIAEPTRAHGEALEVLDGDIRVRLTVNNFTARNPWVRNALVDRALAEDFGRFLDSELPEVVHVHHLAGHAINLIDAAVIRGVPIVYQLQDWWSACARVNLLDSEERLCSGPGLGKCTRCLPLTKLPPAPLVNRFLYASRGVLMRRAVRQAAVCVAGSAFLVDSYRSLGLLGESDPVEQLSYGIDLPPARVHAPRKQGAPLRCGFIGSLLPHKGAHVAAAAFAHISPESAELTLWGDPEADPAYTRRVQAAAGSGPVRLAGRFPENEKASLLDGLDLLLVPSLGLESFGLVIREAFQHGIPVVASRRGALVEAFRDGEGGTFFDPDDSQALSAVLARILSEPDLLPRWAAGIPPVKSAALHAEEIEAVYERLLARRR
jgi:GT2 family glycosyltransferase/glycosyltransferase involved in cell wall biosynthesis